MNRNLSYLAISLLVIVLLATSTPWPVSAAPTAQAVTCVQEYTVQADDWLSNISAKFLGRHPDLPGYYCRHQSEALRRCHIRENYRPEPD